MKKTTLLFLFAMISILTKAHSPRGASFYWTCAFTDYLRVYKNTLYTPDSPLLPGPKKLAKKIALKKCEKASPVNPSKCKFLYCVKGKEELGKKIDYLSYLDNSSDLSNNCQE